MNVFLILNNCIFNFYFNQSCHNFRIISEQSFDFLAVGCSPCSYQLFYSASFIEFMKFWHYVTDIAANNTFTPLACLTESIIIKQSRFMKQLSYITFQFWNQSQFVTGPNGLTNYNLKVFLKVIDEYYSAITFQKNNGQILIGNLTIFAIFKDD